MGNNKKTTNSSLVKNTVEVGKGSPATAAARALESGNRNQQLLRQTNRIGQRTEEEDGSRPLSTRLAVWHHFPGKETSWIPKGDNNPSQPLPTIT